MTKTSELALGASLTPTSSSNLARAALAAGVQEAVLLDSGYSTSLVYDSRIIAVGRKTAKVPSRPVPHAIVVMGIKQSTLAQRASSHVGP
jgi:poly-beta-1,6-N-acetyl-D-glucosamine N-deacetylase